MRGAGKSKQVVTSGRLTGRVKVQPIRKRVTGPAARPEPAYSLYSTDSEDQVTSLHNGLDRCAALLGGILQAERAEALPSLTRAVKGGTVKSKPSTSTAKRTVKKIPPQTASDQKRCQSVQSAQCGPGSKTPRTRHQSAVPAAHSGVQLHPTQRHTQTSLHCRLSPSHCKTLQHLSPSSAPSQTSIPSAQPSPDSGSGSLPQTDSQSASEAPHTHHKAECDGEEEDFVPVRDTNTHSTATHTHTAATHTQSHTHTCTLKMSNLQLEPGEADRVLQDTQSRQDCTAETEVKERTVQFLLGELKALIAGQGSVAEKLLSRLEQTVFSPRINVGSSDLQTEADQSSLHSDNTQLHRGPSQRNDLSTLQEELSAAQLRLQELQDDVTDLRKALQDTQSQLRDRESENTLIRTDLEATRSRLLNIEREKSELSSLAQQRLEEIEHLKRTAGSRSSSDCPALVDSSVSETLPTKHLDRHQHRRDPAEPRTDRVTHYLMSLGQLEPTAAEREPNTQHQNRLTSVQLKDTLSHPDVRPQQGDKPSETSACHQNSHLDQSHCSVQWYRRRLENERGRQLNSTLSQCDEESVWSDWSTRSGSTFNTRDEAAFRDGLSALDASIASLQRTIQLDLRR